jgi:hypothetical protein
MLDLCEVGGIGAAGFDGVGNTLPGLRTGACGAMFESRAEVWVEVFREPPNPS